MTTLTVTKVRRRDRKRFACTSGRHGACAVDLNHFNLTTSFTCAAGVTRAVDKINVR
jgi:hypothetical protein